MNPPQENLPPPPSRFSRWWPKVVGGLVVVLLGIQLIPVKAKENPASQPPLNEPPEVVAILKRSCYDCHSHEVRWPWYSQVAPASWLVARDVIEGRESINFSEWPDDPDDRSFNREQIWDSVESGEMPLWFYLPMHPEARLSDADKAILKKWSETEEAGDDDEEEDDDAKGDDAKGDDAKGDEAKTAGSDAGTPVKK